MFGDEHTPIRIEQTVAVPDRVYCEKCVMGEEIANMQLITGTPRL